MQKKKGNKIPEKVLHPPNITCRLEKTSIQLGKKNRFRRLPRQWGGRERKWGREEIIIIS